MIRLKDYPTRAPEHLKKDEVKELVKDMVDEIGDLQRALYAQKEKSLLIVYQGMDGSGKDGATHKVFKECHPLAIRVASFKKPTELEFGHDFLWRIHKHAPEKGIIQIFNRSHYEDVLIQAVHGWIDEDRIQRRLNSINAFEDLLVYDANTTILKFYLHISYEQQEKELQERLDEHDKHWKHNSNDWEERKLWPKYMEAYEKVFNSSVIPWHIIPVDQRWYRDYCIAKVVLETMRGMNLTFPPLEEV